MSLGLVPACSHCHSYEKVFVCTQCHTISYCSQKCEELDWEVHKKFCLKNESQEQALKRRTLCLAWIQANEKAIFGYLIKQQFFGANHCLSVQSPGIVNWQYPGNLRKLESQGYVRDITRLDELEHETARSQKSPSLIAFYQDAKVSRVYLFSSKKFISLHQVVSKIPEEMLLNILRIDRGLAMTVSQDDEDTSE